MKALDEVRDRLPPGGSISLVEVAGGVRVRATYSFRHRLDGVQQTQSVGSDPGRVYGPGDGDRLEEALREARSKIDSKARLQTLGDASAARLAIRP